jgi:hypothetical protein
MPGGLSSADRRLFLGAGVLFAVLVLASAILTGGSGDTSDVPSTYSVGSGGSKAAYLVAESLGYRVERWEQSVRDLPPGRGATLILADPESAPVPDERRAVFRFVEEGGTVIATGVAGSFFLPDRRVAPDEVAGITWQRQPALSPSAITRAAPGITLAPMAYWSSDGFTIPLYGTADRPRVVEYPYREGRVIWLAAATPFTNAGLREQGNVEFLLACLGPADRRILWDESFHGHRRAAGASVTRRPLAGLGVQLGLLAVAVALTFSRRSGPIVPSRVERRLSPLEFVRTLGSLYQRAGATSVTVDVAYRRFLFALTRRLGLAIETPIEEIDHAVRGRWQVDRHFAEILRACEAARTDAGLPAAEALRLNRALHDYATELSLFAPPKETAR